MNITSPILKGAAHAAALPGDSVTSFLKTVADTTGLFADDSSDGVLGILMSGLAGVATAITGEETRSQQHDAFAIRYRVL